MSRSRSVRRSSSRASKMSRLALRATQRRELARGELVSIDDGDLRRHGGPERLGVQRGDRPQRDAQHEVQVDLELVGRAGGVHEGQAPLASSVLARHALDGEPLARADRCDRLLHLRLVCEHGGAVAGADVVEVDVHGQPRHVEEEEVERRSALERDARTKEGVRAQRLQQAEQAKDLLQRVGAKAERCGGLLDLFSAELHATSSHERVRTCSGTIRFQRGSSLPPLRCRRSK